MADEADRVEDDDDDLWKVAADEWVRQRTRLVAERDALAARLAEAEKVVEAAGFLRDSYGTTAPEYIADLDIARLVAAVDAYRTHEPEPSKVSDPCPVCGEDNWPAGSAGNARRIHELDQHEGDPRIEPRWRKP